MASRGLFHSRWPLAPTLIALLGPKFRNSLSFSLRKDSPPSLTACGMKPEMPLDSGFITTRLSSHMSPFPPSPPLSSQRPPPPPAVHDQSRKPLGWPEATENCSERQLSHGGSENLISHYFPHQPRVQQPSDQVLARHCDSHTVPNL